MSIPDYLRENVKAQPRLRKDLNYATIVGLPDWSTGPRPDDPAIESSLRSAGVESLQVRQPSAYGTLDIPRSGMGRALLPADVGSVVKSNADAGLLFTTLHLGHGFETDDEACRLVDAALSAQATAGHIVHLETHRATITQDPKRTLDLVAKFPDIRFTADFSHWYTGAELPYGDILSKFDRLQPVFERVRSIHGRIGDSACMQTRIDPTRNGDAIQHMREMWRRCFVDFKAHAPQGAVLPFAAELLPAKATVEGRTLWLNYARTFHGPDGEECEESDRWAEAETLWRLAFETFEESNPTAA